MFTPLRYKFKFKNYHRAHLVKRVSKSLAFPTLYAGVLGLKVLKFGFLFPKHLKSIFFTLNKLLKKIATVYIFAFPKASLTSKAPGARMGKGKGKILSSWVFKVVAGFILCEIHTKFISIAVKALKLAQYKLPFSSKIVFNSYKLLDN